MPPPSATSRGVRVSASTSNLGPGFDVVGLALDLELELVAHSRTGAGPARLTQRRGEAQHWPGGESELCVRAFRRAFEQLGGQSQVDLEADSHIPVSRGLGSSGAAIAAGLLLGEALAPRRASREQLLAWALELEGHPDNVTPALFGGCALTAPRASGPPRVVHVSLSPALGFSVAWPETTLETAFARSLLPAVVPHGAAVETARKLALVLEGLRTGDGELLAAGNEERLHVPYRLPHIRGGREALQAAQASGAYLATISGSGSALFAVCPRAAARRVAEAMRAAFERAGERASAHAVERVPGAPEVVGLRG